MVSLGGATEASIWSNLYVLGEDYGRGANGLPEGWSSVPYGRPLSGQSMFVLDEELQHCEDWVTGAIFIGGVGVAKGYFRDADRSSLQFITHPRTGEKLFRTGDLGRVRPALDGMLTSDGQRFIEILGREDSQVKVNGFRIELGEIERVLGAHPEVASAALAVHSNSLCAYIVRKSKSNFDLTVLPEESISDNELFSSLREACRQSLTDYMIPRHFETLPSLPLSSNGKVMRDRLPPPTPSNYTTHGSKQNSKRNVKSSACINSPPTSELEEKVLGCIVAVLKFDSSDQVLTG